MHRSYEFIAKFVMHEFQGQSRGSAISVGQAGKLGEQMKQEQQAAIEAMQAGHAAKVAALGKD